MERNSEGKINILISYKEGSNVKKIIEQLNDLNITITKTYPILNMIFAKIDDNLMKTIDGNIINGKTIEGIEYIELNRKVSIV